jgi:hypothetical protein
MESRSGQVHANTFAGDLEPLGSEASKGADNPIPPSAIGADA